MNSSFGHSEKIVKDTRQTNQNTFLMQEARQVSGWHEPSYGTTYEWDWICFLALVVYTYIRAFNDNTKELYWFSYILNVFLDQITLLFNSCQFCSNYSTFLYNNLWIDSWIYTHSTANMVEYWSAYEREPNVKINVRRAILNGAEGTRQTWCWKIA